MLRKKNEFSNANKSIQPFIFKNRTTLKEVPTWMDKQVLLSSYYNYGVPDYIEPLLDLDIGTDVTYSDTILYLSRNFKKINYLELGVSVGKNFMQMAEGFSNAKLTGFDIENIYPILERRFSFLNKEVWMGMNDSLRREQFSLTRYSYKTNTISYIAADIWHEKTWEKLQGQRFNVIFSDALHDAKALLWEYEMIQKFDLLDDEFVFVWDDLNNGLEQSFYHISALMKAKFKLKESDIKLVRLNGWLGQNEGKHSIGIVTNVVG